MKNHYAYCLQIFGVQANDIFMKGHINCHLWHSYGAADASVVHAGTANTARTYDPGGFTRCARATELLSALPNTMSMYKICE